MHFTVFGEYLTVRVNNEVSGVEFITLLRLSLREAAE